MRAMTGMRDDSAQQKRKHRAWWPKGPDSRWRRRTTWTIGIVLLTWLLTWLGIPPLVKYGLQQVASDRLGRSVTVGEVDFRPWSLALTLRDLAVAGPDGAPPQLQVRRLHANAAWQSVFRLGPVLDALQIDDPSLSVTHQGEGRYDFDDILQRLSGGTDEPSSGPLRFAIYNVELRGGRIVFRDEPRSGTHEVNNLTLSVPFIANLDSQREVKVRPHLAFRLDGSTFDSQTETTPFTDDHQTDARLKLDDLDLTRYTAYLPADLPVALSSGRLDLDLRLSFTQQPKVRLKISGGVAARQVVLKNRQSAELIAVDGLRVRLTDLAPLEQSIHADSVSLENPRLHLGRDAQGRLNLAQLTTSSPAQASRSDMRGTDWQVRVDQLAISAGQVNWSDQGVPGGAQARLDGLTLDARQVRWPLAGELPFKGSAEILVARDASGQPAALSFEGLAKGSHGKVDVSLDDLDVTGLHPYLAQTLRPRLGGQLGIKGEVQWGEPGLVVRVADLHLRQGTLACADQQDCAAATQLVKLPARTTATLATLQISDAEVRIDRQQVRVGKVWLDGARVQVTRDAQGRWMYEHWLSGAGDETPVTDSARHGQTWDVLLDEVLIRQAALGWRDDAAASPVAFSVSDLSLDVKGLAPLARRAARPSPFRFSARMGAGRTDPGRLLAGGTIALQPLAVQAKISASRLPLHALEPYVASLLNMEVRRADTGFKGELALRDTAGGIDLRVTGDAMVDDFRARTLTRAQAGGAPSGLMPSGTTAEPLLNWKSLALQGIGVRLQPGQPLSVDIRRTALSDFFARIVVQESGRLNLQDLVRESATASDSEAGPSPSPSPVIRFGPVEVSNGTVAFADRFIKPNYSADITELNGQLSAFSSQVPEGQTQPDMAGIRLSGLVQGTAALEVTGQLNPLAQPLALDIEGHVRGLELPALSPYSVKYAGHGIERGKMSMDVQYKVLPDGQLTASNRLVLNQLEFGEQVEGAPASLPVKLATALLADRSGVIDVDLPISGSLNDPEFSLGGLIIRAITNLIVKAVTAPFSLLASALDGDGADANVVAFAPGLATLDDAARASLDKVAQALIDRPRLRMTVVGQADLERERAAWKRAQLRHMVQSEKRRQAVRAGQNPSQVGPVQEAEYPELLRQIYRRADIKKPRNVIGLAKDIPVEQMEALLVENITVPDDAMNALAVARGVAVRDHLASRGVPLDRLFLGAVRLGSAGNDADTWAPQAQLSLALN